MSPGLPSTQVLPRWMWVNLDPQIRIYIACAGDALLHVSSALAILEYT